MLYFLYFAIFAFFLSSYMFIPFFALYVRELGGSYVEFAMALSVTGFLLSIIQSYIGYLSDKIGSGFLVISGGIISALGFLFIGITYNKILIFPLYLIMNVGTGILTPSVFSLISYQRTVKGNSFIPIYRSIQGAGVIIGPILGGRIMKYSYRINVILGSLLMLFSTIFFLAYFLKQDSKNFSYIQKSENNINFKQAIIDVIYNRSFMIVALLFILVELSYDLVRLGVPIISAELNFGTDITGTALSAYFIIFTLFQIPVNNILRKMNRRTALVLMGILSLFTYSLLLFEGPAYAVIFIMGGVGLTIGSLFTFCSVLAAETSPDGKKGTFMGVFNTILPFTDVISPILVVFFMNINIKFPYVAATILILVFIILSIFFYTSVENVKVEKCSEKID